DIPIVTGVLPAALIVFVAGLIDDIRGVTLVTRLTVQITSAVLAYSAGVRIEALAGVSGLGWVSPPLTVAWLGGCANAFNLIDGVDGLAAGVGLVAAGTTLFAAFLDHNVALALVMGPLVGALLAFLHYNFNPATISLGECGGLTTGFLLGCSAVLW